MKKMLILILLLILPMIKVNALTCYSTSFDNPIDLDSTFNFPCKEVEGDTLTFKYNNNDISKHFKFEDGMVNILDKNIEFSKDDKIAIVIINDSKSSVSLFIKNKKYVEPSTTTTTTTKSNIIEYSVTFYENENTEKKVKTCSVDNNGEICYVTLPNLDNENFSGWGTAPTCKEGNTGSFKVDKDITYYACYKDNDTNNEIDNISNELYLKSLEIYNMDTEEKIEFGTFSIKKREYVFKVLNQIENLKIVANTEDNINIEITGGENLIVGENEIIIKLTDKDNNNGEYKLKVTRLKVNETLNSVHYLKALAIGNFNIDFKKEKFIYNLTIPSNYNKLAINPVQESQKDQIEIIGNENLINGSVIKINVSGEDDIITTYTINIIKQSSTNLWLLISIGIVFVLIIILIILIIIKKRKNKSNTTKPTPNSINESVEVLNL